MNIFIIFITFLSGELNADVAIIMIMWDKATSNHGGQGLACFIRTLKRAKRIYGQGKLYRDSEIMKLKRIIEGTWQESVAQDEIKFTLWASEPEHE